MSGGRNFVLKEQKPCWRTNRKKYYDPLKETRIKCNAGHTGLKSTLQRKSYADVCIPIIIASKYSNLRCVIAPLQQQLKRSNHKQSSTGTEEVKIHDCLFTVVNFESFL